MPDSTNKPDLTEFYKYSKPKRPPCKVGAVLGELGREPKKQLVAALATDSSLITPSAVVTWMEKRCELHFSPQNVINHRNGRCTCADA